MHQSAHLGKYQELGKGIGEHGETDEHHQSVQGRDTFRAILLIHQDAYRGTEKEAGTHQEHHPQIQDRATDVKVQDVIQEGIWARPLDVEEGGDHIVHQDKRKDAANNYSQPHSVVLYWSGDT